MTLVFNALSTTERRVLLPATLAFAALSLALPSAAAAVAVPLFAFAMVVTGIPHGATDHLVYQVTHRQVPSYGRFLVAYLLAMALYAVAWWFLPVLSLLLFIVLSAYHFGQSQWLYLPLPERHPLKLGLYVCWGLLVLLSLLWFRLEESTAIIDTLLPEATRAGWPLAARYGPYALGALGVSVVGLGGVAYRQGLLSARRAGREALNLAALLALFAVAPLLLGFAVYFGLWHALRSVQAEIALLQRSRPDFGARAFARAALPFSLISFAGVALLLAVGHWLAAGVSSYLLFFIAISTVTLPHMVFMQRLYERQPQMPAGTTSST